MAYLAILENSELKELGLSLILPFNIDLTRQLCKFRLEIHKYYSLVEIQSKVNSKSFHPIYLS